MKKNMNNNPLTTMVVSLFLLAAVAGVSFLAKPGNDVPQRSKQRNIVSNSQAVTVTIQGRVFLADTNAPVDGVQIYCLTQQPQAWTLTHDQSSTTTTKDGVYTCNVTASPGLVYIVAEREVDHVWCDIAFDLSKLSSAALAHPINIPVPIKISPDTPGQSSLEVVTNSHSNVSINLVRSYPAFTNRYSQSGQINGRETVQNLPAGYYTLEVNGRPCGTAVVDGIEKGTIVCSQNYFLVFLKGSNLNWQDKDSSLENTERVVARAANNHYNGVVLQESNLHTNNDKALIDFIHAKGMMAIVQVNDVYGDFIVNTLENYAHQNGEKRNVVVGSFKTQRYIDVKDPNLQKAWDSYLKNVQKYKPDGYFLNYDEERVYPSLIQHNKTPGQLFGETARDSVALIRHYDANAPIFIWGDMFDVYDNAAPGNYRGDKFHVNGSFYGSWQYLPKDVIAVNWNNRQESLTFWQQQGFTQIISSYFDDGKDEEGDKESYIRWGHPNYVLCQAQKLHVQVSGFMYTTWRADYQRLENDKQQADQYFVSNNLHCN